MGGALARDDRGDRRDQRLAGGAGRSGGAATALAHFPAKWEPVRRRKCDRSRTNRANSESIETEIALAVIHRRSGKGESRERSRPLLRIFRYHRDV
jgi:hypothetical protein